MTGLDFLKTIDERCGTTTNMTALSVITATTSGVLMIFTIPINSIIVYLLFKGRKEKYNCLFYKLLLNIAIADLLTGLIADPSAILFLIEEALRTKMTLVKKYMIHVSLFFTDGVALLTLSFLSVDRFVALVFPIAYYKGIKQRTESILVFSAWPFALLLVVPYFKLDFIKQLLVFSSINIVLTILSLIVTTITYKHKLKPKYMLKKSKERSPSEAAIKMHSLDKSNSQQKASAAVGLDSNSGSKISTTDDELNSKQAQNQQRATKTFILMLCVFIATYLPTAFTMIYMNACKKCDCVVIHIMRDISVLSILSSSVFRPLNFILNLKHLKASVVGIFKKKKERQNGSSTSTS